MSARIVGVHGIGNRQPGKTPDEAAAVVGDRWTTALSRGLGQNSGVHAVVAYYAHHLATDAVQGATDPEYLSEPEQQMLLRWAAALDAPMEVAQGRLATPARASADWIARRFALDGRLVRLLVTVFCRELHRYLSDPGCRAAARDTVAETIADHHPAVVLAHSLGSVVAYEALWARPDLQVDLLVTLGSPLALPGVVFSRLDPGPSNGRGVRPPGVRRWINIADPGDVIAVPRGLTHYFDGVDADLTTPIGVFDIHKSAGYLSCPTTATALAALLGLP